MNRYPIVDKIMLKYDEQFYNLFQVHINKFIGLLVLFGYWDFDLFKFNDYMISRYGYKIKKDGSLKQFLKKKFGQEAVDLIQVLIKT